MPRSSTIVRAREHLGQPARPQYTGWHKLDLSHYPVENPAHPIQIFADSRHPARYHVIHHAVFEVPRIPEAPVLGSEAREHRAPATGSAKYSRAGGSSP